MRDRTKTLIAWVIFLLAFAILMFWAGIRIIEDVSRDEVRWEQRKQSVCQGLDSGRLSKRD